jgi:hypothetical protein
MVLRAPMVARGVLIVMPRARMSLRVLLYARRIVCISLRGCLLIAAYSIFIRARRVLFMVTPRADIGADAPADLDSDALSDEGADDGATNAHPERPADTRWWECIREQHRAPGLLQLVAPLAMAALGRPSRARAQRGQLQTLKGTQGRLRCCAADDGVVGRGALSHYRVLWGTQGYSSGLATVQPTTALPTAAPTTGALHHVLHRRRNSNVLQHDAEACNKPEDPTYAY